MKRIRQAQALRDNSLITYFSGFGVSGNGWMMLGKLCRKIEKSVVRTWLFELDEHGSIELRVARICDGAIRL